MDEYDQLGLAFCDLERESILKLCKKLTKKCGKQRPQLLEDAYHEALRVAGMCLRTYDGRVTIRTHVLGNMRWYIWKMLTKQAKAVERSEVLRDVPCGDGRARDELVARDQVEYLMEQLPSVQAELLRWRFIDELSIKEIAELLDCASSTACSYVQDALEAARALHRIDTGPSDL